MKRIFILALALSLMTSCASWNHGRRSDSLVDEVMDILRTPPPIKAPPKIDKIIATLSNFQGTVLVMSHGKWGSLPAKGMSLYPMDRVLTQEGTALITFTDGTRIGLCKNSSVFINHWTEDKSFFRTLRARRQEAALLLGQLYFDNRQTETHLHIMTPSFVGVVDDSLGNLSINPDKMNYVFFEEGGIDFFNPVGWSFQIGKYKEGKAGVLSDSKADEDTVQQAAISADAAAVQAASAEEEFNKGLISEAQKNWMIFKAEQRAAEADFAAADVLYKNHPDPEIVRRARWERDFAKQQIQDSIKALAKAEEAGAVPPKTEEEKKAKTGKTGKISSQDLEEEIGFGPAKAPADGKNLKETSPEGTGKALDEATPQKEDAAGEEKTQDIE